MTKFGNGFTTEYASVYALRFAEKTIMLQISTFILVHDYYETYYMDNGILYVCSIVGSITVHSVIQIF